MCLACGSTNQRSMRYCVACGHVLASIAPAAPVRVGQPAKGELEGARAATPSSIEELAGGRAVPTSSMREHGDRTTPGTSAAEHEIPDAGLPSLPPGVQRQCPRCRAAADPRAYFCRACGAALADTGPSAPTVSPARAPSPRPPLPPNPVLEGTRESRNPGRKVVATAPVTPAAPARWVFPACRAHADASTAISPNAPDVSYVEGAEQAPAGRLVLIGRDGGEGPTFTLRDKLDIGRLEGTVVVGDDRYLSPRHARIVVQMVAISCGISRAQNRVFLRIPFVRDEANETNPRAPLDPEQELGPQELFLVGQQVLRFEVVKHAEEGLGVA